METTKRNDDIKDIIDEVQIQQSSCENSDSMSTHQSKITRSDIETTQENLDIPDNCSEDSLVPTGETVYKIDADESCLSTSPKTVVHYSKNAIELTVEPEREMPVYSSEGNTIGTIVEEQNETSPQVSVAVMPEIPVANVFNESPSVIHSNACFVQDQLNVCQEGGDQIADKFGKIEESEMTFSTKPRHNERDDPSSTDSSASSESDFEFIPSDDEEEKKLPVPKSKLDVGYRLHNELGLEDLPPIENLQIHVDQSVKLEKIGHVSTIIDVLVIVQSFVGSPALNMDTILFTEDKTPIGQVFETFGPVAAPLYSVRFNLVADIEARGVAIGMDIYYALNEWTSYIFMDQLKQVKGSDASWEHDLEPPPTCLDYSDDEQEQAIKKQSKRKKRPHNDSNKQGDAVTQQDSVNNWLHDVRNDNSSSQSDIQTLSGVPNVISQNRGAGSRGSRQWNRPPGYPSPRQPSSQGNQRPRMPQHSNPWTQQGSHRAAHNNNPWASPNTEAFLYSTPPPPPWARETSQQQQPPWYQAPPPPSWASPINNQMGDTTPGYTPRGSVMFSPPPQQYRQAWPNYGRPDSPQQQQGFPPRGSPMFSQPPQPQFGGQVPGQPWYVPGGSGQQYTDTRYINNSNRQ